MSIILSTTGYCNVLIENDRFKSNSGINEKETPIRFFIRFK